MKGKEEVKQRIAHLANKCLGFYSGINCHSQRKNRPLTHLKTILLSLTLLIQTQPVSDIKMLMHFHESETLKIG